jgi:periplasmic copper chaperone A
MRHPVNATSFAPGVGKGIAMSKHQLARPMLAVVFGLIAAADAVAQVAVTGAWVRGTVAGQKVTGAFMQMTSPTDTVLVAVTSPVAKTVEIHQMKMDGGMMKMNAIDKLPLPAGKAVELKPGGYHVMLFDLQRPVIEGDLVPLTLTFEDKGGKKSTVEVKAVVKALGSTSPVPKP